MEKYNLKFDEMECLDSFSVFCSLYWDTVGDHNRSHALYVRMLEEIHYDANNILMQGAVLFGLAEHIRMSCDKTLLTTYKGKLLQMIENISFNWQKPNVNIFGDYHQMNTSTLGILYGGLRNINNYFILPNVNKVVKEIREYVFKHNISKASLVNGNTARDVSIDIILSVVPFSLFEPEDLILVEAVKNMEKSLRTVDGMKIYENSKQVSTTAALLLSWYYTEKGDYRKAKELLTLIEHVDRPQKYEAAIYGIIMNKLERMKQISEKMLLHQPYGNNNPYEPMNTERFPKSPIEGDKIQIRALAWPLDREKLIDLEYWINKSEKKTLSGEFITSGEGTFWQWEIGPFFSGDTVHYQIYFNDEPQIKTQLFECDILGIRDLSRIISAKYDKGSIRLNGVDENNKPFPEMVFEVPDNGLVKLHIGEYKLTNRNDKVEWKEEKDRCIAKWEELELIINYHPFSYSILYQGEDTIDSKSNQSVRVYEDSKGLIHHIECFFHAEQGEQYYGFGERYNHIDQRGNRPDVYVYNQYKGQGMRTYMPIPFFISSNRYGFYIESDYFMQFDMASENTNLYSFKTDSSSLSLTILFGEPKKVIERYTAIIGKPSMMPKWAFGPWMSSNNWDSEEEVRKQVELTKKHHIPSTVLVIEAWSDEATFYIFNDSLYENTNDNKSFSYDDFIFPEWGRWPDPKGMIEHLHNNNLKCILWQIPIMKSVGGLHHLQKDADESYMISKGYCVKTEDGQPYRIPEGWFKDSLLMDFSNEEGKHWWFEKRKYLVEELEVDGFKTDGGEFVFGRNLSFNDGKKGDEMRNQYPNTYIEAYYDFINQKDPLRGITFSRAGFTGAGRFPAHWAGDERSTFPAFRRSIIAGLTSGMSGIPFWGWDLGGFSGDIPTAELFIRSAQMAAFCPIMQYHAESKAELNQDRTPWNIADRTKEEKVIEYYRYYANLRMNLIPYIYQMAKISSATGLPMMRAMVLAYPNDSKCRHLVDQYMFGDHFLVAPIVEEGSTSRKVYLPEGKWIDFWDESIYNGKEVVEVESPIDRIPLFVKYGAIIPMNLNKAFEIGGNISNKIDTYENLCFKVYGIPEESYAFIEDHVQVNITVSGYGEITVDYKRKAGAVSIMLSKAGKDVAIKNQVINHDENLFVL